MRNNPLPEGYKPCLKCKAEGKWAFTEMREAIAGPGRKGYEYPYYYLSHWCSPEEPYSENSASNYCHGHGSLTGNRVVFGQYKEDVKVNWNRRNTKLVRTNFLENIENLRKQHTLQGDNGQRPMNTFDKIVLGVSVFLVTTTTTMIILIH